MNRSDTIGALAAALAKAQGEMATAAKDSTNPHFHSKYADLASIWNAAREPLAKNGIAVVQAPGETAERVVTVTTLLSHASGEWIEETLTIPMAKVDAQGYGSAVTYARRYALAAMVGIAPAEDDGNAAAAIGGDNAAPRRARQEQPAPQHDELPTEPANGWADWANELIGKVNTAPDDKALDQLRENEKRYINGSKKADEMIYGAIGNAFTARRNALKAAKPAPMKEAA